MMKKSVHLLFVVAATTCSFLMVSERVAADVIVYQQTFDNGTGTNQPPSNYSWTANINPTGTAATAGQAFISPAKGDPTTFGTTINGFFEFNTVPMLPPKTPIIAYTQDSTFFGGSGIDPTKVTTISWYQGNTDKNDKFQIAVQDHTGAWFVSQQTFTQNNAVPTDADFTTKGNTIGPVTYATLTWNSLNFVPGSSLVEGGASSGPSGNLTAIGLFLQDTNGITFGDEYRFDTFTINAVPEPSSLALTFLGGGSGFVLVELFRRRRRCAA
jgi:hypothetical protein